MTTAATRYRADSVWDEIWDEAAKHDDEPSLWVLIIAIATVDLFQPAQRLHQAGDEHGLVLSGHRAA